MAGTSLEQHPLQLGLGASAIAQPAFTGAMDWYADYSARHAADGAEGRLVTTHTFTEDWTSWEMHPAGDEVVLCLTGEITLHQEFADGRSETVTIGAGEYAINSPGGVAHRRCRGPGHRTVHNRRAGNAAPPALIRFTDV